jgi:predicted permease
MDYEKIKVKKKLVHFLSKDFKNFIKKNLANLVYYPHR